MKNVLQFWKGGLSIAHNGIQIKAVAIWKKIDQILDSLYDRVIEPMEAKGTAIGFIQCYKLGGV